MESQDETEVLEHYIDNIHDNITDWAASLTCSVINGKIATTMTIRNRITGEEIYGYCEYYGTGDRMNTAILMGSVESNSSYLYDKFCVVYNEILYRNNRVVRVMNFAHQSHRL